MTEKIMMVKKIFWSFCSVRHGQKVVCGNKSKKVSLDHAEVTVPKIREILRTKFEVEETIRADIKYYENDFEEWVDLGSDSEECIQNLNVIKVKIF